MPKTIYVHLLAICLLVACKPSAEAKPLTSTATPSATPSQNVAPAASAHRGPKGITSDYLSCLDRASGTIERAECMSAEAARQDSRLNNIYKKLVASLDKGHKDLLVNAQREWLVLREKDGAFEASLFDNNQAENLASDERDIFYTCERADRLQEWLDMVAEQ